MLLWIFLVFYCCTVVVQGMAGKLHYWSMKARGYGIAVIAKAAGCELDWPRESEDACDARLVEHQAARILPFNQWPMVELEGGKRIVQSGAIMRFYARRGKIDGGDSEDAYILNEQLMCEAEDIMMALGKAMYDTSDGGNNKAAFDKLFTDLGWFPRHAGYLEQMLTGPGPYFQPGPKRLAGAYYLACVLDIARDVQPTCLDATPKLKTFLEAMLSLPEFVGYSDRDIYFRRAD